MFYRPEMVDPLTEIATLLEPSARFSKLVSGAGAWSVRRAEAGQPFYCVVLEGGARLEIDRMEPIHLQKDDFILIPAAFGFSVSGLEPTGPCDNDASMVTQLDGETRHGRPTGPPDTRLLVGYCAFGSPDAKILVALLPQLVHIRGEAQMGTLVQLVARESSQQRPGRDAILARLLEVLLMEALRSAASTAASPGLLRGLADGRLASAIRRMHEDPARPWTIASLAKEAALSRTTFFERFSRAVGVAPMEYLLAWRMALARNMLQREELGLAVVAERVGYSSASTFSVAFTRHVGMPPGRYIRTQLAVSRRAAS